MEKLIRSIGGAQLEGLKVGKVDYINNAKRDLDESIKLLYGIFS